MSMQYSLQQYTLQLSHTAINYYQSSGSGQTIVFVHGNSKSALQFSQQLQGEFAEQYRVIALDLPGHGLSGRLDSSAYTIPSLSNLLVEFSQALQLQEAIFVGWSLGGNVVMHSIERLPQAKGFVIVGAVPFDKPMNMACLLEAPFLSAYFEVDFPTEEIEKLLAANKVSAESDKQAIHQAIKQSDAQVRSTLAASIFHEPDYRHELAIVKQMQAPLTFIFGMEDNVFSIPFMRELVNETLTHTQLKLIPQAVHFPHISHASAFNQCLAEIVEQYVGR
ncbi:hypothetical protein C2869_12380 [Saccharobesus litoralis]|uniref:AB hydrolase-1 domain-containing protein n=1 Tax=Saccharobesus litoralis TaxID=2172099 RepID=A0A2S0VSM8_9ALTE|nr:alpha/beta hydrolase [Saccharobesus litoralis]AWB67182.1 hypothetical protein C2869_12380 [Saccharobesus litoralis]